MAKMTVEKKAEMYRKQLGGVNAALNRERSRSARLKSRLDSIDVKAVGAGNRLRAAAYDGGEELVVPLSLVLDEIANIMGAD